MGIVTTSREIIYRWDQGPSNVQANLEYSRIPVTKDYGLDMTNRGANVCEEQPTSAVLGVPVQLPEGADVDRCFRHLDHLVLARSNARVSCR